MLRRTKNAWEQIPLFRLIWPLIGGIAAGVAFPDLSIAVALLVITAGAMLCYMFLASLSRLFFIVMTCTTLILAYVSTSLHTGRLSKGHFSKHTSTGTETNYSARIVSDPIVRERSIKVEVEMSRVLQDDHFIPINGNALLYLAPDSTAGTPGHGDHIVFRTRLNALRPPDNPGQFDYRRYMHLHQISHQAYVPTGNWIISEEGSGLMRVIKGLQHNVIKTISAYDIHDRELAIVSALLVGYRHYLSADQVNAFASAGAMHVLAVSGLHVGIVFLMMQFLLKPLSRWTYGQWPEAFVMLSVLWFYAALTGLSPSVTRAATMFSFVAVSRLLNRNSSVFNSIAASAVFLLLIDPYLIVEVGFQLSYLAVLGIVLLQPRIYGIWQPRFILWDKLWALTSVSIAAQSATFPLGLLYFHQFPNYFLLSNLVVIPAATAILPVGISAVLLSGIPYVSVMLGGLLYYLLHWLDGFIQWMEQLPLALTEGIDIGIIETCLLYCMVGASVSFLLSRRYNRLVLLMWVLCVMEGVNIVEQCEQRNQRAVVIYKIRDHHAIDFISGHSHVFKASDGLMDDDGSMNFNVFPHWWQRDLNTAVDSLGALLTEGPGYLFHGLKIVRVDDSTAVDSIGRVDVLWIVRRTHQHPREVLDRVLPEVVVLSDELEWRSRRYWSSLLDQRSIPFHDMREKGAFVLELPKDIQFR